MDFKVEKLLLLFNNFIKDIFYISLCLKRGFENRKIKMVFRMQMKNKKLFLGMKSARAERKLFLERIIK